MANKADKIWEVAPRKFDDLIDQLLFNRGIINIGADEQDKIDFFRPEFAEGLHDPYLLSDMLKAVSRIKKAVLKNEVVGIFGDYDADGIPAAVLLSKTFSKIGLKNHVYIPNREDGYGLSQKGIDLLIKQECSFVVTVDLGIRSLKEATYCQKKNIDLIITDHHLPGEETPSAFAVINPKRPKDKYPYKELCGCGVAYKLVQGLAKEFPKQLDEKFLKWNLDLVAISTISDVVPLTGENRVLAKFGLMVINKTQNLGLSKLVEVAGLKDKEIEAYHIGFQIGPRINAPGRIDHATKSFELLITEDEKEARELAFWLNEKNDDRQVSMDKVQKEAIEKIEKEELYKNKILIIAGDWQKGVIGPAASRLVEKFFRPVILFAKDGEELVGSARSIPGVNIVEIFEKVKNTIKKFGGHKGAAGIAVSKGKYDKFISSIQKVAEEAVSDKYLVPKIKIDAQVKFTELSKKLYEKMLKFEPFGMGNSRPVFAASDVVLEFPKFVGKEQNHLSMLSSHQGNKIKSICFNFPYEKKMIKKGSEYDIAFTLDEDNWNNESKLSLNVIDIKKSCENKPEQSNG